MASHGAFSTPVVLPRHHFAVPPYPGTLATTSSFVTHDRRVNVSCLGNPPTSGIKATAVVCLVICFSVGDARAGSTYDVPGPANGFFDGNDVHSWCQSNKSMAQAYTAGLWDLSSRGVHIASDARPSEAKDHSPTDLILDRLGRVCEPDDVALEQVTEAFCAYLRNAPEMREKSAAILFAKAMTKAWPCKKP
jgi:hypothetical protein